MDVIGTYFAEYTSFETQEGFELSGFCSENGGYWVTHINHDFDKARGGYERVVSIILYQEGYRVVLGSEKREFGIKSTEGLLNGVSFEICSVEGIGKNNIKDHFNKCNKKGAKVAVIYYPNPTLFSMKRLREGYAKYLGNKKPPLKIIYILNGHINIFQ